MSSYTTGGYTIKIVLFRLLHINRILYVRNLLLLDSNMVQELLYVLFKSPLILKLLQCVKQNIRHQNQVVQLKDCVCTT